MIAEANPQTGLLMESLMATVAQSDKEAKTPGPRVSRAQDRKGEARPDMERETQHVRSPGRKTAPRRCARISFGRSHCDDRSPRGWASFYSAAKKIALGDYPGPAHRSSASLGQRRARIASSWRNATAAGFWRQITYAQIAFLNPAHRLRSLLARGPFPRKKPVVILSGNSIPHAPGLHSARSIAGNPRSATVGRRPNFAGVERILWQSSAFAMRLLTPLELVVRRTETTAAQIRKMRSAATLQRTIEIVALRMAAWPGPPLCHDG